MKSTTYSLPFRAIILTILIAALSSKSFACGPYPPIIPTPTFFTSDLKGTSYRDDDKRENLLLWQKLTSAKIPLRDIEQIVYESSLRDISHYYRSSDECQDNLFFIYLHNTKDYEIFDFLITAKEVEEVREQMNSPWYYPSSRNPLDEANELNLIIGKCTAYEGSRLKDRYALQTVRAMFASRQYAECVEHFERSFRDFPDTNLFKRMAMRYVAGCWARLGDVDRANEYFAMLGDLGSIASDNPAQFMALRNPDSPELMSYIQSCATDSAKFCAMHDIAGEVLRGKKVTNRGDWEFALAYMYGEFHSDYRKASHQIRKALREKFSTDDLREHASAYRIKTDAENGNYSSLLSDLRWLESKVDLLSKDANEWNRMMQNIVYRVIPELWNRQDYTTAILLCGYADNLYPSRQYHYGLTVEQLRASRLIWNDLDYCSLSFQLMGSLSSGQLIKVKQELESGQNALHAYLRKYARTDADYLNELIGTLALREENYSRAVQYLSSVSEGYEQTMNVYHYLDRDPFYAYPARWAIYDYGYEMAEYENRSEARPLRDPHKIKYAFAKEMLELQSRMRHGRSADERGLARLKYAIGRHNSFEECWALTQYWRGEYVGLFEPVMDYSFQEEYPSGGYFLKNYDNILYDYEKSVGHEKTEAIYRSEVEAAMAMLQSDEYKAEAEYMLGNLKTVVKRYGNTAAARHIKTSCDRWRLWL